jgi:hypothetical protein
MASSRRTPCSELSTISTCSGASAWLSMNHCMRFLNPGSLSTISGSRVSVANSGTNPTIDRTFKRA